MIAAPRMLAVVGVDRVPGFVGAELGAVVELVVGVVHVVGVVGVVLVVDVVGVVLVVDVVGVVLVVDVVGVVLVVDVVGIVLVADVVGDDGAAVELVGSITYAAIVRWPAPPGRGRGVCKSPQQ